MNSISEYWDSDDAARIGWLRLTGGISGFLPCPYPPTTDLYSQGIIAIRNPPALELEEWGRVRAVQDRAEALLHDNLTPEQRQAAQEGGSFEVTGSLGTCYRIRRAQSRNVDQMDGAGAVVRVLCAAPRDVPVADKMLAQKLLLETDEMTFLCVANSYVLRDGAVVHEGEDEGESVERRAEGGAPWPTPLARG